MHRLMRSQHAVQCTSLFIPYSLRLASIGIMGGLNVGRFTNYGKTDAKQNADGTTAQQSKVPA
ncbi:hypothetical protein [Solimicrobium silvestre]|uniref:Uncharacterized protein n=1 Tax=Solimicrobium silvestre TaxID=2099400 RepID=A0A2S9GS93_9BURK|nr:hypothetical protein [Solimicrobium silvestre]PRC90558.1 hypothetical protein S2091_4732 [Solimicrobium silvestre]